MGKRIPWLSVLTTATMLGLGVGTAAITASAGADSGSTPGVQLHLDTLQNTTVAPDGTSPMGTTPDSSGNNLNATASGVPVSDGRFQGALSLLYGDNGVTVPNNAALQPTQVTVMAWVRFSANPGANRLIVAKPLPGNGCGHVSYGLTTGASGGVQFNVATDHGDLSGGIEETSTPESGTTSIWNGQWHAIAGTYDGTTIRLWVDGALAQSTPVGNNLPLVYDTSNLYAGLATSSPGCDQSAFRYGGQIDEIRVYGRALSQSEIQYLQGASATTPPDLPPPTTTTSTSTSTGSTTTKSTTTTTKSSTTSSTSTSGGPLGRAPIASFLVGRSLVLPGATRFSGLSSRPSLGGRITDFHWTIIAAATPTVDTDCGKSPVLSHPFTRPGIFHVTLTVTDSLGRRTSASSLVNVGRSAVLSAALDPRTFDCENPAKGEQPNRADCIKSYGFGIVDVNSRGKPDDCFEIKQIGPSPNANSVDQGTIAGPVAINGLYVPIPESVKTVYASNGNVSVRGADLFSVRVGTFLTQKFPLQFTVKPNAQGVFHVVKVDPAVDTPKFLGALPISGSFAIDLTYHASHVKIGLGLPSPFSFGGKRDATGTALLISDNVNGLHYDGLALSVPDLWLGPIFVSGLNFSYEKSTNTWQGGASVQLPGAGFAIDAAGPPTQPPDFGFGIKKGRFDHAGFGVDFTPPAQPDLFPPFHTVLLSHIGAAVGINPFRLTGTIGLSAANLVDENGVLFAVFASAGQKYTLPEDIDPELAPLAGRTFDRFSLAIGGTAQLKVPLLGGVPLLNAYGLYEYPDYFEFGGGFRFGISFLSLTGNVYGFAYPSSGKFDLQAGLQACTHNLKIGYKIVSVTINQCLTVGGVISSKGFGVCGVLPVPFPIFGTIPVPIGLGYLWGGSANPMIFSCDYSPYAEASPLAGHIAADSYSVNLPSGLPSAMFRVRGLGAAPALTVTDPHGQNISGSADAVTMQGSDPDTTLVGLKQPLGGRWTITAASGSAPIVDVATAHGLPAVGVHGRVTARGGRRVLHYRLTSLGGRIVTFVERARGIAHVIGVAHGPSGAITFTPKAGRRGRRSIVGLVEGAMGPGQQLAVASYLAPAAPRLGRPRTVRATRRRGSIRVDWTRVPGAVRYEVLVQLVDHSQTFQVVRRPHAVLTDPFPAKGGTVTVDALGMSGDRGSTRTVRIKRVPGSH